MYDPPAIPETVTTKVPFAAVATLVTKFPSSRMVTVEPGAEVPEKLSVEAVTSTPRPLAGEGTGGGTTGQVSVVKVWSRPVAVPAPLVA